MVNKSQRHEHAQILDDYLMQVRAKTGLAFKDIAEKVGLNAKTLSQWRFQKRAFDPPHIAMLNAIFGLEPEKFGLPPGFFLQPGINKSIKNESLAVEFLSLENVKEECQRNGGNSHEIFYDRCFTHIYKTLEKTKEIFVLDYLADKPLNSRNDNNSMHYANYRKRFFTQIEDLWSNSNLEYHRVLQLPVGKPLLFNPEAFLDIREQRSFPNSSPFGNSTNLKENHLLTILLAIDMLTPEALSHIKNIFHNKKSASRFSLSILPFPLRTYTYLIADNVIITMYPKYSRNGTATPDILFINNSLNDEDASVLQLEANELPETHVNRLIRTHRNQIKEIKAQGNLIEVDKVNFESMLSILENYYSKVGEKMQSKFKHR